jgi:hypothetical protein
MVGVELELRKHAHLKQTYSQFVLFIRAFETKWCPPSRYTSYNDPEPFSTIIRIGIYNIIVVTQRLSSFQDDYDICCKFINIALTR